MYTPPPHLIPDDDTLTLGMWVTGGGRLREQGILTWSEALKYQKKTGLG